MLKRDQILAALPALSKADLKAIGAAVAALSAGGPTTNPEAPVGPQAVVFDAMAALCGARMGWGRFSTSASGKHFSQNAPVFSEFMQRAFGAALHRKVARLALAKLLLGLLANDLIKRRAPVSMGSLALNLHRVEEVFDRAYPGYLQAGLCNLVCQAALGKDKQ